MQWFFYCLAQCKHTTHIENAKNFTKSKEPDWAGAEYWENDIKEESDEAEQVRHGRWIDMKYNQQWFKEEFKCSECGEFMLGMANYCPNCGAKMDGKGEKND